QLPQTSRLDPRTGPSPPSPPRPPPLQRVLDRLSDQVHVGPVQPTGDLLDQPLAIPGPAAPGERLAGPHRDACGLDPVAGPATGDAVGDGGGQVPFLINH